MEQTSRYIERYCTPTNLDIAPFGTLSKVIIDENKHELYIQLSHNDKMKWERLGMFFEQIFEGDFISNPDFINTCLDLFKELKDKEDDKLSCSKTNDVGI